MFCRNCGAQVKETDAFCLKCGTPIKRNGPAQPQKPAPPPAAQPAPSGAPTPAAQPAPAYGASNARAVPYAAPAAQPAAPNRNAGQTYSQQPAVDWNRMQPRAGRAPATALILCVGMLVAFVILFVWGVSYLSPGGLGEGQLSATAAGTPSATAAPGTPADSGAPLPSQRPDTPPATAAPSLQSGDPRELPAEVAAQVNRSAAKDAYLGSYEGTMRVDTYNLQKLAEISNGGAQWEMFEALAGQTYQATAEFQGSRVNVFSSDFPYASEGSPVLDIPVYDEPVNGLAEQIQTDSGDGYDLSNSQQAWFLSDGRLYLMNAMSVCQGDEYIGGMIITVELRPVN